VRADNLDQTGREYSSIKIEFDPMAHELVDRLRALDLLTTELEGDDWFMAVDAARHEAAIVLSRLHDEITARIESNNNRTN
jgi:hypothetical protein